MDCILQIKGRVINGGEATGEAVVYKEPFSFVGDFDPDTGKLNIKDKLLKNKVLSGKILVCPTGKGGTMAPYIAYNSKKKGNAPAAILCTKIEPIIAEAAITIDIPLIDKFDQDPVECIKNGQNVEIKSNGIVIVYNYLQV